MPGWGKQTSPVDRSVRELERQIAVVQRQMRELSSPTPERPPTPPAPRRPVTSIHRPHAGLFDSAEQSLQDLGAEPIAFAVQHEPDLFTAKPNVPEKLAHYLGAGSIRSFRSPKRGQRETRNRFFMWVGLSGLLLWVIYWVVR
jgi:hypothetical protein